MEWCGGSFLCVEDKLGLDTCKYTFVHVVLSSVSALQLQAFVAYLCLNFFFNILFRTLAFVDITDMFYLCFFIL